MKSKSKLSYGSLQVCSSLNAPRALLFMRFIKTSIATTAFNYRSLCKLDQVGGGARSWNISSKNAL